MRQGAIGKGKVASGLTWVRRGILKAAVQLQIQVFRTLHFKLEFNIEFKP